MTWRLDRSGRIERVAVFAKPDGSQTDTFVGELVFEGAAKRASRFTYAPGWLRSSGHFELAPRHLPLRPRSIASAPHQLPLPFTDWSPDDWGRTLLAGAYPAVEFGAAEYLASIGDERSGELRFGPSEAGGPGRWVPLAEPLLDLPGDEDTLEALEAAAAAVDAGTATTSHLQLLLRNSGDLGGARPKAALTQGNRHLIAKFRADTDTFDDPRIEGLCLDLAAKCGVETPLHETVTVRARSVLLVERFDRPPGGRRLGYCSAGTLVGAAPSTYASDWSYAAIAATARRCGVVPCERELFRRMLLNCFLHNTDDHLRNHGFIRRHGHWCLSPVFDVVPHRPGRLALLPGKGISPTPNPATAFEAHSQFALSRADAALIYEEIVAGLADLSQLLDLHGISTQDRRMLEPLFVAATSPPALTRIMS